LWKTLNSYPQNVESFPHLIYKLTILENMINMISEIKNSVVINKEDRDGDTYLDAYYEPFDGYYPPEKVKEFLEENLPPHMLPRHIMCLDHLPVTPIGKVDKKSLPIIDNE